MDFQVGVVGQGNPQLDEAEQVNMVGYKDHPDKEGKNSSGTIRACSLETSARSRL